MALKVSNSEAAPSKPTAVWRDYDTSVSILIDSLDNDEYQVGLERARRRVHSRDRQAGTENLDVLPGEETEHATQCRLLGQFIVRDWKGAADASGQSVKYSPASATATLRDDVEFFLWVLKAAAEVAAQHHKEVQETLGKSSTGTGGSESGAPAAKNES